MNPRQNPHSWSYVERQGLVLLKRVFSNSIHDLTKLMNYIFPCAASPFYHGMITSQYIEMKTWLGNAGSKAAYASIWRWDFETVRQEFVYLISRCYTAATSMAIDLTARSTDESGELRIAKKHRRKHPRDFNADEWLNDHTERLDTPMSLAGDESDASADELDNSLGRFPPLACKADQQTPISPPTTPRQIPEPTTSTEAARSILQPIRIIQEGQTCISQFKPERLPSLLFRCTGPETAGASAKEHIYSGRHAPFIGRQVHVCSDPETLLDDCELHLGRHEVHSSLISTTPSLVWVIMKFNHLRGDGASKFLYIIDAQSVNEDTQVLAGHLLIKELRSRNRFQPSNILSAGDATQSLSVCKYAGYYDFLVYGRIARSAIRKRRSLAQLKALAQSCQHVARFLRLHLFEDVLGLKSLFQRFRQEPVELDASTGIAIAKLMIFLGVDARHEATILTSLWSTLLQNWQVKKSSPVHSRNAVKAFVEAFAGPTMDNRLKSKAEHCAHEAVDTWTKGGTKSW